MTATSEPTSDDKSTLKNKIASSIGVDEDYLKDFTVTSQAVARRSVRRSLLASYKWTVAFTVKAPLSETTYESAASFSVGVKSVLTSDSFVSAVSSSVGATVDVTSVSSEITATRNTPPLTASSVTSDNNETSSAAMALFAVLGILVIAAVAAAVFLRLRRSKNDSTSGMGAYSANQELTVKVDKPKPAAMTTTIELLEAGSVVEFLQLKAKFSSKRALVLAKNFAEQGYEAASDFQNMTEIELSDQHLKDTIGLLFPEMRNFRDAVAGAGEVQPYASTSITSSPLVRIQALGVYV
jgi:hypothetical protein